MIIIPAVDIKQGKCVRLCQGRMDQATEYGADPAEMALKWASMGAQMIHVVDLDGAFAKTAVNIDSVRAILKQVSVPIQVGGGIRDLATIETYLAAGVTRVIIGSEAVYRPEFVKDACQRFPGKIMVGIDARNGRVAVEGGAKCRKQWLWTWPGCLKPRAWQRLILQISIGTECRPVPISRRPRPWQKRCPFR